MWVHLCKWVNVLVHCVWINVCVSEYVRVLSRLSQFWWVYTVGVHVPMKLCIVDIFVWVLVCKCAFVYCGYTV